MAYTPQIPDLAELERLAPLLGPGPLVRLYTDGAGSPRAAASFQLVEAPAPEVWQVIRDLDRLPAFIHMIEAVRRLPQRPGEPELVRVDLRFKIAIFSARFHFVVTVERRPGTTVDLVYHSGKVRDLHIRLQVAPQGEARSALLCYVAFDPGSLGWLVNVFIRHHPEIEWGIHAGSAMSIASSASRLVLPARPGHGPERG